MKLFKRLFTRNSGKQNSKNKDKQNKVSTQLSDVNTDVPVTNNTDLAINSSTNQQTTSLDHSQKDNNGTMHHNLDHNNLLTALNITATMLYIEKQLRTVISQLQIKNSAIKEKTSELYKDLRETRKGYELQIKIMQNNLNTGSMLNTMVGQLGKNTERHTAINISKKLIFNSEIAFLNECVTFFNYVKENCIPNMDIHICIEQNGILMNNLSKKVDDFVVKLKNEIDCSNIDTIKGLESDNEYLLIAFCEMFSLNIESISQNLDVLRSNIDSLTLCLNTYRKTLKSKSKMLDAATMSSHHNFSASTLSLSTIQTSSKPKAPVAAIASKLRASTLSLDGEIQRIAMETKSLFDADTNFNIRRAAHNTSQSEKQCLTVLANILDDVLSRLNTMLTELNSAKCSDHNHSYKIQKVDDNKDNIDVGTTTSAEIHKCPADFTTKADLTSSNINDAHNSKIEQTNVTTELTQ